MDGIGLLPLPLPADFIVPAALAMVVLGGALLMVTYVILFHTGAGDELSRRRLGAAVLSFSGGLVLPTLVVAALLLTPRVHTSYAAGLRPAKAETTIPGSTISASPGASRTAVPLPAASGAGVDYKGATQEGRKDSPTDRPVAQPSPTSTAKSATLPAPNATPDRAAVARGKALIKEQNCQACHRIDGQGGSVGPDLSEVGRRRDADWLLRHFRDPQAVSPGTLMPRFQLPDADFGALTSYMLTLRGSQQ